MNALKEWAVVCKALQEGRQTILLRKGGILEFRQGFEVKHDKFMLFPTYEHQEKAHLQSGRASGLDEVLSKQPSPGTNILSAFAEVKMVHEISDPSRLKSLEKYHIWNESYVNARMAYNPKKPMSVMLLRVYNLANPITVNTKEEWVGCKSWIPLDIEATGVPAIDDDSFGKISTEISKVLSS